MDTLGIIGTITGVLGLSLAVFAIIRQAKEQARNNCLMFLADRIFDSSIPREFRQPFYEEYISMKGNGTAGQVLVTRRRKGKKGTTELN
jgi:hypothetical protein